ncbi:MAG: hypothetical protein ABW046_23420 [Actinoplanes sp.]
MARESSTGVVGHGPLVINGDVAGTMVKYARAAVRRPANAVDVLVITARPVEFTAVRNTATGRPGVLSWQPRDEHGSAPYLTGDYRTAGGRRLTVALARPTRTGGRSTAPIATTLANRLKPACLAMAGVCSGSPSRTLPGDVVIADRVYEYDEGRLRSADFEGDHQQYQLDNRWLRAAQDFRPDALTCYGPAGDREVLTWLLERLDRGEDPARHQARDRYLPPGTFRPRMAFLTREGLVEEDGVRWALTGRGRTFLHRQTEEDVRPAARLPFAVHVGPMASGSAEIEDPRIWPRLRAMGIRSITALDQEAATVATIAHQHRIRHWLVAKGVTDQAEPGRDSRYEDFAAHASAEVLWALLADLVPAANGEAG